MFYRVIAGLCAVLFVGMSGCAVGEKQPAQAGEAAAAHGKDVVRAEAWGFSPDDATEALQAAIDSGARTVIVGRMPSPWLIRPIQLPDDIELVFESGVVVQALPGAFLDKDDCLFQARGRRNITLRGHGATLLMNKSDYQDPTRYVFSEWRHAISLLSCENVTISGLHIRESGGDGIYVGVLRDKERNLPNYCRDIVIEDVVCDANHRQGISVISVENLLIRNSTLSRTDGTAPMAGIDFEPNNANERLVNCVLENCVLEDNTVYGFTIHTSLSDKTEPISITLRDCIIRGGGRGIVLSMATRQKQPASGFVAFERCHITGTRDAAIEFRNKSAKGFRAIFRDCRIDNCALEQPRRSAIMLSMSAEMPHNTGNAEFSGCRIEDATERPVMQLNNFAETPVVEALVGDLIFNGEPVDVAAYVRENGLDKPQVLAVAAIDPADLRLRETPDTLERPLPGGPVLRGAVSLALAARQGEAVTVALMYEQINRRFKPLDLEMSGTTPSGKALELPILRCNELNEITFTPTETGIYVVSCDAKGNKISVRDCSVPFSLLLPEKGYLPLYRPNGRVYFAVPAGIAGFKVEIAGQGAETLDAEIWVEGQKMAAATDISAPMVFEISCAAAATTRVGSIVFSHVVEDVMLKLPVPLVPAMSLTQSEVMALPLRSAP